MKNLDMIFAGFGGQGVLFSAKVIAYAGLTEEKQVSWLPSYGPEMRGGTANCSVCVSDDAIGSPLVTHPDVLVAMNLPSYEKFITEVKSGGTVIIDSAIVSDYTKRDDVNIYEMPATRLANDNDLNGLANIILIGKLQKETQFCSRETLVKAIKSCVPKSKEHLLELNMKALEIGEN